MIFTNDQLTFLNSTGDAATKAGHIFPAMAACEAALESGYGTSQLARVDHNLFGMKQHQHPVYGTHILPTREFVGVDKDTDAVKDGWVVIDAKWVSYPSSVECFIDRMNTLRNLSHAYPHYAAALAAPDAGTYVVEVSKTWSTDPHRADKILNIYHGWTSQ